MEADPADHEDMDVDEDPQDPDDPIIRMTSPLVEAIVPEGEPQIFAALRYNDVAMVERQLREGADVNTTHTGTERYRVTCPTLAHRIQTNSYAPLHIAALHSTLEMIKLLLDKGADVNIVDEQRRTALHLAVVAERISLIKLLVEHGADIDVQSSSGRTPLLEAAINNSDACCRLLISAGANLDLKDTKGTSFLLHLSFARSPKFELVDLAIKRGADVNITNLKGAPPLMFAVAMKNVKLVQTLVQKGANINQRDSAGRTPIQYVIEHKSTVGRMAVLLYLLHQGASINVTDKSGVSMLNKAVKNMSIAAIKVLLLAESEREAGKLLEEQEVIHLCDVVPSFKDWLLQELHTPKSLMRICRQNIRQCLPQDKLLEVCNLELPKQLQDYLLVRDLRPQDFS